MAQTLDFLQCPTPTLDSQAINIDPLTFQSLDLILHDIPPMNQDTNLLPHSTDPFSTLPLQDLTELQTFLMELSDNISGTPTYPPGESADGELGDESTYFHESIFGSAVPELIDMPVGVQPPTSIPDNAYDTYSDPHSHPELLQQPQKQRKRASTFIRSTRYAHSSPPVERLTVSGIPDTQTWTVTPLMTSQTPESPFEIDVDTLVGEMEGLDFDDEDEDEFDGDGDLLGFDSDSEGDGEVWYLPSDLAPVVVGDQGGDVDDESRARHINLVQEILEMVRIRIGQLKVEGDVQDDVKAEGDDQVGGCN